MPCSAAIIFIHLLTYVIALPVSHAVQHRPFAKGSDVFGSFTNYSDWTSGVAVPFTWFTALWVNSAWSAPAYIVETTHDAQRATPKAMLSSYLATAGTGMVICLISAFCITDMDTVASDPSGFPLLAVLLDHWGPRPTAAFLLVIVVLTCVGGSAVLLTYSFQVAALARDGGLPFSSRIAHVNKRANLPVYAIIALSIGGCLVLLFSLSAVAKEIIYSLAVLAVTLTLAVPNLLRLLAGDKFVPGPWNLGRFSKPVFAWAFLTQLYSIIMEAFPSSRHFNGATFNYNWVLTVGAVIFSAVLYLFLGKSFNGIDFAAIAKYRQDRLEGEPVTTVVTNEVSEDAGSISKADQKPFAVS